MPPPPPRTVLLVEDYADIRLTLAEVLRAEAFDVREAGRGEEGLALLARLERPCLILLDLELPDMDGFEFARRLRALPRPPADALVILTGRTGARLPEGATGLLHKPFELQDLLSLVDAHAPGAGIPPVGGALT
jgi:two-component system KDP operon response regulator KdpE